MNNSLYEFRKLDELINEIIGLYPRLNDKYTLNKSDAINWGVYVLRQLGYGAGDTEIFNLEVSNHMVKIPTEVKIIDGVYRGKCNSSNTLFSNFNSYTPIRFVGGIKSNIISDKCAKLAPHNAGYTFSINYPFLIFNFTDSCISFLAQTLKIDPDTKIPMYKDDESTKQAIHEYILYNWMREPAMLGEYDYNLLLGHKDRYDKYFLQAKNSNLTQDQLEAANSLNNTNYRYSKFHIPRRRGYFN